MNKNCRILLTGLVVVLLHLGLKTVCADIRPGYVPAEIIGIWIGYESDGLTFCRLTLNSGNKGVCTFYRYDDSCQKYEVTSWENTKDELKVKLFPSSPSHEKVLFTVTSFRGYEMLIQVKAASGEWQRKLTLHKEEDILQKIQRAKECEAK